MNRQDARPIIFNDESVYAILDGRKTQTRRVIRPQPAFVESSGIWWWEKSGACDATRRWYEYMDSLSFCPYGQAGDCLWVQETWNTKNPMTLMPRWASRITLDVVNVRVERVQEISIDDCIASAIWFDPPDAHGFLSEVRLAFQERWDFINAKHGYGWNVNPWVWVIEFRQLTK